MNSMLGRLMAPATCGLLFLLPLMAIGQQKIDFARDVKPILSNTCFVCHGPDAAQRSTDLRFDQKESAFSDLGGYSAIVPGNPAESELISRIFAEDEFDVMPPPDHLKQLTDEQKSILRRWIAEGADWSEHWAFVNPHHHSTPKLEDPSDAVNFIDAFVLSRLRSQDIVASPVANRHTLLRRLSFDLTGLPPTVDELQEFDVSESGYEAAVDRLLASPHFGERLAVYWLDLVRYADSVGYHGDQPVEVTPFRDYVIDSFNENLPFDQFTLEQLAGDLIEEPTQQQMIASGYNRLGMMSAEGGVQPEEYLAKYAADRVRTTATVWLGITLGCAECHDHKFDPVSTREFYEFAAFFADIKEKGLYEGASNSGDFGPSIPIPDPDLAGLLQPIDQQLQQLVRSLQDNQELRAAQRKWEASLLNTDFRWQPVKVTEFSADPQSSQFETTADNAVLLTGPVHRESTYVIQTTSDLSDPRAIRLEALPDESLPQKGPGRAGNGNFVVTEFLVFRGPEPVDLGMLDQPTDKWPEDLRLRLVELSSPTATFEQVQAGQGHPDKKWSAASAIDNNINGSQWGWAILPKVSQSHEWVARIAADQKVQGELTIVIQQHHPNHALGKFRISTSNAANATSDPTASLPGTVQEALAVPAKERNPQQLRTVSQYFWSVSPESRKSWERLVALRETRRTLVNQKTRTTLVTVAVEPREMRVLARGNWMDRSGDVVEPGVPVALGPRTWEGRGTRKDLAEWITRDDNPVAARVFVNRIWRLFFGSGLSNVMDDFGSQGELPSHPELLDRLAIEFVDSGWDVKHLVKLIVMSRTYRQSSAFRNNLQQLDPENRLLARQSSFRLDAEFVRDHALKVSGLLMEQVGGRNGKPYQPPGLYRHLNFPKREYQPSTDSDQYRRGLYTHWQRQYLHPAMKTLDAPPREECTAARPRSSTPLAALLLLNDPSYVEAARNLADRSLQNDSTDAERIDWLFQTCFSRNAREGETDVLLQLLADHRVHFEQNADAAGELLNIGLSASSSTASSADRAAWTSVCRAIMNTHEFVLRK